ncbi:hypothetical protein HUS70_08085 [Pandoraea nosoerga]|uniref:DUF6600 domain-containing protein n=1 Tax=Pandoraea nosoerga TaxID=2508296 RepID=UPI00197E8E32|nr:DUF6600 domain-containing protein [Pandoraea nosoerga]MBN4665578.1 hypothetical protein [Pandoraea nosoerga]MBN4675897.1 hypothetical protein [Pandoraea nosoerga]MBN4680895.1 hypothetical protein [Pandoraea nosoerga]MBN4744619.1 hypothetical protein [Pandoraea nosoerga]
MKPLISWRTVVRYLGVGLALGALGAAGVPALAQAQSADPPSRVARLNEFAGTVTYAPAGTNDWRYADRNRPLTTGDAVWVERNSRAEMHVGGTAVRMGPATSVALSAVTDENVQLNVTQGTLGVRLRSYDPNQPYEIDTPNLAFVPQQAGEYRVDVNPNGVTTVSVWRGAGTAYGQGASVPLQQGQRVAFVGQNLTQQPSGPLVADTFDQWMRERDAREDASVSARYVPRDMTGFESLDDYGQWQETPTYGAVWVPSNVPSGWAPYRTGHWVWVDPWGWTWIDDAPWGFAPYHYGRWAYVDARWCWVPGPAAVRPVYAPALVGWVGGSSGGNAWGVAFAAGGVGLAWFALGPHDPYRPAYHASSAYITNVNRSTIVKTTNITNINVNNVYVNRNVRGAVSTLPAQAFVQGRPVGAPAALAAPRQGQGWRVGNTPGVAPVQQSLVGSSRPAAGAPPAGVFNRQVLATRAPAVRAMTSRELTSNLHPVPNAGGTPLAFGANGRQGRDNPAGRANAANGTVPARVQPRVMVVSTRTPVGAPISGDGENRATEPARAARGAAGAAPAQGGLPPTGAAPSAHGVPQAPQPGRSVPHPPAAATPGQPSSTMQPPARGEAPQGLMQPGHDAAQRDMQMRRRAPQSPEPPQSTQSPGAAPSARQVPNAPNTPNEGEPARRAQQWQTRPEPSVPQGQSAAPVRPRPQYERAPVHPESGPQSRPERRPETQPMPSPQPQPQTERAQSRPALPAAPQARPQPHPEPQPAPQARPQPQPERPQAAPHPQPQERPHPQPAPRENRQNHTEGSRAPAHDERSSVAHRPSHEGVPPRG